MRFLNNVVIGLFAFAVISQGGHGVAYGWGGHKYKKDIREFYIGKKIEIIPQNNKIHTGFGSFSLGEFHYVKSLNKIFFRNKAISVAIKEIDFDDDVVEVKLFHPKYGYGEIAFVLSEEQYENTDVDKFGELVQSSLSRTDLGKVVVNSRTGKYHLPSSNHLPPDEYSSVSLRSDAGKRGFEPCGFCFKHYIYLPEYHLEEKMAQKMAAELRHYSPVSRSDISQLALIRVGKKVLNNWPIDLLGYDYSFVLIDSPVVNAYALPGGQVFLTNSLYDSLEDPLELEAILAHEIAHVERRHTLKAYRKQQEVRQTQAFIAALGGAAAGFAASRGNGSAASASIAVSVTMMALAEIANGGYSKDQEREADLFASLYFEQNGLDKKCLGDVFKKLQFVRLCEVGDPDPASYTHPQLRERFDSIETSKFKMLDGDILFCSKEKLKNLYIDPIFSSDSAGRLTIIAFIGDRSFVSKKMHGYDVAEVYMSISVDGGEIMLGYSERDTVYTEFGAILTFSIDNRKHGYVIGEVGNVELIIARDYDDVLINAGDGLVNEVYKFSAM